MFFCHYLVEGFERRSRCSSGEEGECGLLHMKGCNFVLALLDGSCDVLSRAL
jgi:hypothetical protein